MRVVWVILFALNATFLAAQSNVSGVVKDENGEALPGVTVRINTSNEGTITGINGEFRLPVKLGDILSFSSVGMVSQQLTISNFNALNITMEEATTELNEVVVTGFQELDRKLFTGASESLGMDDIRLEGAVDVSRMLEGQAAGVSVDNVSGTFGSSPRIRIRGNASINGNNQPLN